MATAAAIADFPERFYILSHRLQRVHVAVQKQHVHLYDRPKYIGLQNYVTLFTKDKVFAESFWNNLIIALVTVPISLGLAIGMAIFANKDKNRQGRRARFLLLPHAAAHGGGCQHLAVYLHAMYGLLGHINPSWHFLTDPGHPCCGLIAMLIWKRPGLCDDFLYFRPAKYQRRAV